jgi:C_GCAxxG_C_C family probable redox protein
MDTVISLGQMAGKYFNDGYCCSEAMVKATIDTFTPDISKDVVRLATGFCGGMGNRKGPCGVFTGGIMALGIFVGRTDVREDEEFARSLSNEFVERLERAAESVACKDILKGQWLRGFTKCGCRKLTVKGAEILADMILQYKLYDGRN